MKIIGIALLLITVMVVADAQAQLSAKEASGVVVVKHNWTKQRRGWEKDPFSGPIENIDEMRARARAEKRIEEAKRGNPAEVDKLKREARADAAIVATQHRNPPSRYVFIYKVTVKNASPKTIKRIDWDYVFLDGSTENELARQQFTSDESVSPGKTRELTVVITRAPTKTISVDALNKGERDRLGEKVEIMRIEYADGAVWQRP